MIAQYTTVDINVNVINDKEISLILSDSNIMYDFKCELKNKNAIHDENDD